MIKKLLDASLGGVDLHFVPMSFSSDMDEIGRFRWKKLLILPLLIARIWRQRFKTGSHTLYYPPGGESLTAIYRDIILLFSCRVLFRNVVFHVHSGGFTDVADTACLPVRFLAYRAYRKPDMVIQLTEKSPPDGERIKAEKVVVIPNGLEDSASRFGEVPHRGEDTGRRVNVLFVGVVSDSKGCRVLLDACRCLHAKGVDFSLRLIGRFYSPEFEAECRSFVEEHDMEDCVLFAGVKTGDEKWEEYRAADIFCLPSFFKSENQSLVILEAMQFGLPCVASDWRGMSSMIIDGETGYLVPIHDSEVLAERIETLLGDPVLRSKMGKKARELYLENFTDEVWCSRMEEALQGSGA